MDAKSDIYFFNLLLPCPAYEFERGSWESNGEPAALQTLRDHLTTPNHAKRLDCGDFSTALAGAGRPAIFHRPAGTEDLFDE